MSQNFSEGFSTAELLIAIFVGAAFILTGYQLFGIIASSGGDARNQAVASGVAYSTLRQAAGTVASTCGSSNLVPATIPSGTLLPGTPTMFIQTTCPYGSSSAISEVAVYLYYGTNSNETVEHATLASQ